MIKKLLFLYLILLVFPVFAQNFPLSDQAEVSVFTCGKGEELYTTFGHTAIRVKDLAHNIDVVYNYGMFDFREGNFYLKFVKGDLQYFVAASSYDDFMYEFQVEQREVIEQTLNLTLPQKQKLFDLLNTSLMSDDKFYTYKFIDRNCTTMVQDKISAVIGKTKIEKVDTKTISYREVLYPYFENYFWYKLGINIIFGIKVDQKAEKLFLPIELLHSLNNYKINGKPLVKNQITVLKDIQPKMGFSFFNSIYLVALLLLIIALINKVFIFKTYLFLAGLLGIFLCVVGLYSYHEELLWNYNALLFNPLFVLIPFLKNKKLLYACGVMLIIYCLLMLNKPHFFIMIPFVMLTFYILFRMQKQCEIAK